MKRLIRNGICLFLCCAGIVLAESFVVKKKKGPSRNSLNEKYAQVGGELTKLLPDVHKHIAKLQSALIDDIYELLEGDKNSGLGKITKEQMQTRTEKVVQLSECIRAFDEQITQAVTFLKHDIRSADHT